MTQSSYKKALKQLKAKPVKMRKYLKHNSPKERSCGKTTKRCRLSGRSQGVVQKYGIKLSRQAFRQLATKIGFKQYN